jgi:hypothetical protein
MVVNFILFAQLQIIVLVPKVRYFAQFTLYHVINNYIINLTC